MLDSSSEADPDELDEEKEDLEPASSECSLGDIGTSLSTAFLGFAFCCYTLASPTLGFGAAFVWTFFVFFASTSLGIFLDLFIVIICLQRSSLLCQPELLQHPQENTSGLRPDGSCTQYVLSLCTENDGAFFDHGTLRYRF